MHKPRDVEVFCVNADAVAHGAEWHTDARNALPSLGVAWLIRHPVPATEEDGLAAAATDTPAPEDAKTAAGAAAAAAIQTRDALYRAVESGSDLVARALLAFSCGVVTPWLPALLVGRQAVLAKRDTPRSQEAPPLTMGSLFEGRPGSDGSKGCAPEPTRITAMWSGLERAASVAEGVQAWREACFATAQLWAHNMPRVGMHRLIARPRSVIIEPGRRWRGDERLVLVCSATSGVTGFLNVQPTRGEQHVEVGYCPRQLLHHTAPVRSIERVERIAAPTDPDVASHWCIAMAATGSGVRVPRVVAMVRCRWSDGGASWEPLESLLRGAVHVIDGEPTDTTLFKHLFPDFDMREKARRAVGDVPVAVLMDRGKELWGFYTRKWAAILSHELASADRGDVTLRSLFPPVVRAPNLSRGERGAVRSVERAREAWEACIASADGSGAQA